MSNSKMSFYLIVISQGISSIGGTILRFAISLHVLDLTGSAEAFATMVAIAFLPMALFQPVGGALADRFNKKMLLVISDSTNTVLAALLAVLLFSGSRSVFLLGAVITLLTFVFTCYHPTVTASLPVILKPEELPKANGTIQGIKAVATMAGPVMAGFLFGLLGVNNLVALCAVFFCFSAIINIFIKIPYNRREKKGGNFGAIISDLKEGFLYVTKENKSIFKIAIIFAVLIFFFQSMLSVTLPYTIRISFAMREEFFGFANAAIGVAILLASLVAGKLKKFMHIRQMPYFIAVLGVGTIPVALSVMLTGNIMIPYLLLVIGFMMAMFIITLMNIMIMTHAQTHVPSHMVGKTVGMIYSIGNIPAPIGQFTLGMLIERLVDTQFFLYLAIALLTFALGIVVKVTMKSKQKISR